MDVTPHMKAIEETMKDKLEPKFVVKGGVGYWRDVSLTISKRAQVQRE